MKIIDFSKVFIKGTIKKLIMETDIQVEGNTGELQGTTREREGTAGNDEGNGKTVVDHILRTLRENNDAKKELYKVLKAETGINVEPYLEGLLGERQDKKTKLEDMDMPLREIAENVLQMTTDGYAPSQIASFLGIYPSQVSRILKEQDRWQKEINGQARHQAAKKLPWFLRFVSRFI